MTLYTNDQHTEQVMDRPEYPKKWLPLANALRDTLVKLRTYSDLAWTYVTPALTYDVTGIATGKYHIEGEELTTTDDKSYISYADYATGMIDLIEQHTHVRQRITLVGQSKQKIEKENI
ncbi:NAD(P)-dependent oxidoreductase [Lactiplantibacillus mudanjiangensis]|uniref:NADH-flavin reductase [Lactobacillus mucosae LM1] n=1 Tax=Lactiplantibacillus mudanjiangensis TaxID=1296538 RepID=A0A660E1Y7_9LACO|nr:hypothetical protein [Lactiplantibacillus mudanjiangensis]VDG24735.1 NADH-flavin reductase [Lactobacillus mucosae LM1] [Lactiplantibacillus mudanjiangensis]VDG29347.1 NADH-flavin reductase [Lactobacillus mucosae LM1] [Lactiplantibacillus mudanjiangensis]